MSRHEDDDWYPHDTSYKPTAAFSGEKAIVYSQDEINAARAKYESVEKELAGYGIEFKIKTFQDFETAVWQLNKIKQDELSN